MKSTTTRRLFLPILLAAALPLAAGAATLGQQRNPTRHTVTGRVIHAEKVVLATVRHRQATSYRIEPVDAPGTFITVIGEEDCPRAGKDLYDLTIERQPIYFVKDFDRDESLETDWKVIACRPIQP